MTDFYSELLKVTYLIQNAPDRKTRLEAIQLSKDIILEMIEIEEQQ